MKKKTTSQVQIDFDKFCKKYNLSKAIILSRNDEKFQIITHIEKGSKKSEKELGHAFLEFVKCTGLDTLRIELMNLTFRNTIAECEQEDKESKLSTSDKKKLNKIRIAKDKFVMAKNYEAASIKREEERKILGDEPTKSFPELKKSMDNILTTTKTIEKLLKQTILKPWVKTKK